MNAHAPDFGAADFTDCDKEPIHIPGSIQPHGVLLALDPGTLRVLQVAGDTGRLLGAPPEEILSQGLEARLGLAALGRLRASSKLELEFPRPVFAIESTVQHNGCGLDATIHASNGALIVELEPSPAEPAANAIVLLHAMIVRVQGALGLSGFLQAAAEEMRAATGFDRVMVYQFLQDGSGSVIAEAKTDDLVPYLGLHYPKSDIPKQARELYLRNWTRVIPDANYTPVPILPAVNPVTGKPLDLSFSILRSVSPVHLQYLRNMGVAASMSLSIIVNQKLWGLIACHHRESRLVPQMTRSICEVFAQMISLQLGEKLAAEEQGERLRMRSIHAELVEAMVRDSDLGTALIRSRPNLADYIHADGVAVWWDGKAARLGKTPTDQQLRDLVEWLNTAVPEGVYVTDCLGAQFGAAKDYADVASGLIALSVSRTPRDYVLWFKPEVIATVTWAGNPSEPLEINRDGKNLSPRRSFAAWKETVRGRSEPWSPRIGEAAQALRVSILEVVLRHLDQLMREREQARVQQDLLMAELDHRVKNTIATIQALVRYSAAGAESLDAATQGITERLHAMGRAHSMLTRSRWKGVDLKSLAIEQFAPFDGTGRARIEGPPLMLRPKAALSVSLAFHELTTNAAKYGALSVPEGTIDIGWEIRTCENKRWLVLRWAEQGGPQVAPPNRSGFGRLLLERSLAYDVDGEVNLDFRSDGLVCTAMIPVDQIIEGEG
jgi:light-regulated signal transduction histidine kinase (bacteriophytochrome)